MADEYEVLREVTFNGRTWLPGERIPKDTILRVSPWRLGPLQRRGHIVEVEPKPVKKPAAKKPAAKRRTSTKKGA